MGNQKNQIPAESAAEKKMTKYDRKMQARKEAEAREKRQALITRVTAVIVLALIIVIAIAVPVTKRISAKGEYIRVGNHSLSKIDYDFYYGYGVNSYLSTYSYILPYLGLDTTKSFDSQSFDDTTTWQQYFDQMTVSNISQYLALCDDAEKSGFSYDISEDYDEFYSSLTAGATEQGVSLKSYLKSMFGTYATKSSLKDSVTTFLTAQAYYAHLLEENKPNEIEVSEYYTENKRDYDSVHFSVFDLQADIPEDATDEQKEAALAEAKTKADEFISRYQAGEDFLALCRAYATQAQAETYAAEDASAYQTSTYANMHSAYRDWLFDEARTPDEITAIEDSTAYHIVLFNLREKPDTADDTISNTISSEKVRTYVSGLTESGYDLNDEKNHLNLKDIAANDEDNTDNEDNSNNEGEGGTEQDGDSDGAGDDGNADGNSDDSDANS